MFHYKLVRDGIPDIIRENGEVPVYKIIEGRDLKMAVRMKLLEEANELIRAMEKFSDSNYTLEEVQNGILDECADMLEVLIKISEEYAIPCSNIICRLKQKREEKGKFDDNIFLETTYKRPGKK
jgi:predicted house-cleaning noncanonical NTP pyrophosphatase (MazG superfamily)